MIGEVLLAPRPGPGLCRDCYTPVPDGEVRCRACEEHEHHLAAFAPIAYSVAHESLHREIAAYKRDADPSVDAAVRHLTLLLDRFLRAHEHCLAVAAGVDGFDLVCTVPSGSRRRAGTTHPLEHIVGERLAPCSARYRPLLRRSELLSTPRRFDARRFVATGPLAGESVLLIDDMWTTGASAQSAAAALHLAGAGAVAAVVIGRYMNRGWARNDEWLRQRAQPLDFGCCVYCARGRLGDIAQAA